jgi:hypothetical protein
LTAFLIWVPEPERRSPEPNSIFISRSFPEVSESKNRPDDLFLFHCMKDKFYKQIFCVLHGRWIPKNKNYPTFLPILHCGTRLTIFAVRPGTGLIFECQKALKIPAAGKPFCKMSDFPLKFLRTCCKYIINKPNLFCCCCSQ